jgi:hypothetical protein
MLEGEGIMGRHETEGLSLSPDTYPSKSCRENTVAIFTAETLIDASRPALVHFSSAPLFRLERCHDKYAHLLKKKDLRHISPLVNYFICHSGHVVYLGGDVVSNLYLNGRRRYKTINILGILSCADIEKYSDILNNVISSNDGSFSLGAKYRVKKKQGRRLFPKCRAGQIRDRAEAIAP